MYGLLSVAHAQGSGPSNFVDLIRIVCNIVDIITWILIVLVIVFVLLAAFRYLTAQGDPEKVKTANHTLLYAAIAVVIILIAKGFPYIIASFTNMPIMSDVCS